MRRTQTVGHAKFELTILHERELRLAAKALRAYRESESQDEEEIVRLGTQAMKACLTALYGADKDCPMMIASEGALRFAAQDEKRDEK